MYAITHKIKCALDSKSKEYIKTEKSSIFVGYDYTSELYVIIAGGLIVSFDNYTLTPDSIRLYCNGCYICQFAESSI